MGIPSLNLTVSASQFPTSEPTMRRLLETNIFSIGTEFHKQEFKSAS